MFAADMWRQPTIMCSKCPDISHACKACKWQAALRAASYCGICAIYGHTTLMCPDGDVLEHRKPEFIEQLIPTSLLDTYNIQSMTPLVNKDVEIKPKYEPVFDVYDTDKNIRAILMNHGKSISNKPKENRLRLQRLADELGRKLVYNNIPVHVNPKKTAA